MIEQARGSSLRGLLRRCRLPLSLDPKGRERSACLSRAAAAERVSLVLVKTYHKDKTNVGKSHES